MAITNFFNNYFPREYKYYLFINLFEQNLKSIYEQLVLKKNTIKKMR